MKPIASAALAVLLGCSGMGAASGQIVTDPGIIAGCLCQEQGLGILQGRVDQARRNYERDRARIEALDRELERARSSVDVGDQGQVDAVKAKNLEREQVYARTYDADLPALQAVIEAYDAAAQRYTRQCAGRDFDAIRMAQTRATLSCPPAAP